MAFVERKNILYVGGLDDAVNEEILQAAFIPFGELKSVQVVRDFKTNKGRGYGFVEFELEEDAASAIENMDGSELFGRVLRCNKAKAMSKLAPGKALWNSEEWIQSTLNVEEGEEDDKAADLTLVPERQLDPEDD